jgi:molybdate transport system permease protein
MNGDFAAAWLTFELALVSTVLLVLFGTPLAWWMATTGSRARPLVETLVALPLVLPPTVLGFYLLLLLGRDGPVGALLLAAGIEPLAFSFGGRVVGSVLYSLPFVVLPIRDACAASGRELAEAAAVLGARPLDRFVNVAVPLARRGFVTGATLGFAHTLGEFGVVLMIGGNIPGETQVLSIAIYNHVEALDYGRAHWLAGGLLAASFLLLLPIYAARGAGPVARA